VVFSDVKSNFLQLCYIFDMRSTVYGAWECSLADFLMGFSD
jgi:hypothetical protein